MNFDIKIAVELLSRNDSSVVVVRAFHCDFIVIQLLTNTDGIQFSRFCLWRNLDIYIYIYYCECS